MIKGWKHAGSDLSKWRRDKNNATKHKLVRLKKDGSESKMHGAVSHHDSMDAAIEKHKYWHQLNPGSSMAHNLYDHEGNHIGRLHEGQLYEKDSSQHAEGDTQEFVRYDDHQINHLTPKDQRTPLHKSIDAGEMVGAHWQHKNGGPGITGYATKKAIADGYTSHGHRVIAHNTPHEDHITNHEFSKRHAAKHGVDSQHSELHEEYHGVLAKHGYHPVGPYAKGFSGNRVYRHAGLHQVTVDGAGGWDHNPTSGQGEQGSAPAGLDKHLKTWHKGHAASVARKEAYDVRHDGGSQYAEGDTHESVLAKRGYKKDKDPHVGDSGAKFDVYRHPQHSGVLHLSQMQHGPHRFWSMDHNDKNIGTGLHSARQLGLALKDYHKQLIEPKPSQHAESTTHSLLESYMYKRKQGTTHNYQRLDGHEVQLHKDANGQHDGGWSHTHTPNLTKGNMKLRPKTTSGHGEDSLSDHLSEVHEGEQYNEEQHSTHVWDSPSTVGPLHEHHKTQMEALSKEHNIPVTFHPASNGKWLMKGKNRHTHRMLGMMEAVRVPMGPSQHSEQLRAESVTPERANELCRESPFLWPNNK